MSADRFNARDAWAKLTDEQRQSIGALSLVYFLCDRGSEQCFDETTGRSANYPLAHRFELFSSWALSRLVPTVDDALALNAERQIPLPDLTIFGQPQCRVCGCTDDVACGAVPPHCHWVEPDLCSACVGAPAEVAE